MIFYSESTWRSRFKTACARYPRLTVALMLAAAAVVAALVWWVNFRPTPVLPQPAVTQAPSAPSVMAYPSGPAPAPTAPVTATQAPSIPPAPVVVEGSGRSQLFEKLAASSKPADKFAAYSLAAECRMAHLLSDPTRLNPPMPLNEGMCGDMKPGQWGDDNKRAELVKVAALAGVHGAWWAYRSNEVGQFRNPLVENSPDYARVEAAARAAALASADPLALVFESTELEKTNPKAALAAYVAYRKSESADWNVTYIPSLDRNVDQLARRHSLDPGTVSEAISAGLERVAKARESSTQQR